MYQQQDQLQNLQLLSTRLQQLIALFDSSSNFSSPTDQLSNLISQVESTLVSIRVENLYRQALALGVYDFFPTTVSLVEQMLSLAEVKPAMKVLEPSAGLGHICRQLSDLGVRPDCFELSPLLRQGLVLQGFNVVGADFLSTAPTAIYDRILANPPFSSNGVARHTLHALDWLRPGGRLVTVAHHYQLKPSPTDRAFFQWLKGLDTHFYDCGKAFAYSDRPCHIPIQLIVINKPRW